MDRERKGKAPAKLWNAIEDQLRRQGVDLEQLLASGGEEPQVKVVCVGANLQQSVDELGRSARDQVVMVRVDETTLTDLDAWVEIGAVKSRSEAAALFIREGLRVRSSEIEQLRDALREVERAKEKLRRKAGELFGYEEEDDRR
jgi:hypothetical protein